MGFYKLGFYCNGCIGDKSIGKKNRGGFEEVSRYIMYLRLKGDVFSVCDQKEMSVTKRIYLLSQHILQHSSLFNLCTLTCNAIPSTYEGKQIHKDDSNERADHSSI